MINLQKYDVKIQYIAIHPAGVHPNGEPFIVKRVNVPRLYKGIDDESGLDLGELNVKGWEDFFESVRGKTLIVHELNSEYIRYTIAKE